MKKKAESTKEVQARDKFIEQMSLRDPAQRFGDAVENELVKRGLVAKNKSGVARLPRDYATTEAFLCTNASHANAEHFTLAAEKPVEPSINHKPPLPAPLEGKGKGVKNGKGGKPKAKTTEKAKTQTTAASNKSPKGKGRGKGDSRAVSKKGGRDGLTGDKSGSQHQGTGKSSKGEGKKKKGKGKGKSQ